MARIPVSVVPHTHWDREWYSPFQTFRLRLVELLDGLLPKMVADPSYAHFLLDGQMAVVDDYLAIRPDAEETLRKLNANGRLAMGPWYILMDEFLVSGETMVRDLQLGLEKAARFGGAMEVGYLPDMFGHVAQMPQLLALAGFDHAVVWRGVPSTVDKDAFWWSAPDGSTVRAQYLWPEGYGNGADLSDDSKRLVRQLRHHREWMGDFFTGSILWMNGTDHQVPKPYLGRVVAEVNAMQDEFELRVCSLEEHVRSASTDGLPSHRGELRSGARANLLMGVASNRVDVKIAAARAERSLERRAEPLSALFLTAVDWPKALLDVAWHGVILNSAHDSSCACSHDEVVESVLHRYHESRQIADGLGNRALRMVAAVVDHEGPVLVNASARARAGVVELTLPGEGDVPGAQVVSARAAVLRDEVVDAEGLARIFGGIRSQLLDPTTILNRIDVEDDGGDTIAVTLHADERMRANLVMSDEWAKLAAIVEQRPDARFHVRIVQPPSRALAVRTATVPGYGWSAWTPAPLDVAPVAAHGERGLTNGILTIEVDPELGTFSLDGRPGYDRLIDDGDHGDTYNYSPPDNDLVVHTPDAVSVEVLETGPVRGRIRVTRSFTWPERIDDATRARVGSRETEVVTTLEVRAGEPLVRITQELDNQSGDHRLRTWFPLATRARTSRAECAFGIVERPTTAEGGSHEYGLPTQPCRRFVQASELTVVQEGLLEYELVGLDDDGDANGLALTLLRATGMLSRIEMTYRPMPAGPPVVLHGSQVLGVHTLHYGVAVGAVDPYALVDDAFLPLDIARAPGIGTAPAHGTALTVTGAEVSALRREAGRIELRAFNPSHEPTTLVVEGRTGWIVDLRGRPIEPFEESVALGPWKIVTLRLDD
jgi:alpha-mannosidase